MTSPDLDTYRQRAGVRGRRRLLILVALMPVMIVLGLVVAELTTPGPFHLRAMVMVGGISVAIFLLTIFGVMGITRWRTGRWSVEQSAAAGASGRTRRQVLRNVRRGNLPSNEPDRSLAVDLARTQLRHRWALWVFAFAGERCIPAGTDHRSTVARTGRVLLHLAHRVDICPAARRARLACPLR